MIVVLYTHVSLVRLCTLCNFMPLTGGRLSFFASAREASCAVREDLSSKND